MITKLSSSTKSLFTILEKELLKGANIETKTSIEKYMRGVQPYRGLKNAVVGPIFKNLWASKIKALEPDAQKELALHLLTQNYGEDRYCGCLLYEKIHKHMTLQDIKNVEALIDNGSIKGWANIDTISGKLFKHWAKGNEARCRYIAGWCNSNNLWLQRASCVSFVTLARHGDDSPNFPGFISLLEKTCAVTIKNQERFAQLGTGWLMREIGVGDKRRTVAFIENNIDHFSREGLRYATEKMDNAAQKRMLSLHKKVDLNDIETEVEAQPKKKRKIIKK
jgi:3-methyladenine DNA glycosylase AlkD